MKNELKNLRKNLEDLKDELDRETLKRIDIENKTQTLREEMEFKDSLKEKVRDFIVAYAVKHQNFDNWDQKSSGQQTFGILRKMQKL